MIEKELPDIIRGVGFDFSWDNRKVWALDVPEESMGIGELTWHFEIPFLDSPNGRYDLKPSDVIKYPEAWPEEYERTMKADMGYPIDIMRNKGRWLILDGLHRLMKASIQGLKEVRVRKISRELIDQIKK